jgi:hypothetical protein
MIFAIMVLAGVDATGQTELLAVEFRQDDQAGFALWPAPLSGSVSTANFATDSALTSGQTTVRLTASTSFGIPVNRPGAVDGTPPGFTYQRLYEDLLIALSPTGFLTLEVNGLMPNTSYRFTLYAWDPGASDGSDKEWTVIEGAGTPAVASVNFQDPLVNNETFAMVFEIVTTASGSFQLRNTGGLSQSAVNGFRLAALPSLEEPPELVSPPTAVWDGGEELEISVSVTGTMPLTYQWFLDGVEIPGANQAELVLSANDWDRQGDYTVRVSNEFGLVVSEPAEIEIDIPPFPTRESLTYEPIGPSSRRTGVAISEILYHPAQRFDGRELEFIELYNSQPWAEDLSGWRLSGEVDFTIPNGTLIPGFGYLVVARAPGDVESEFEISGVLGPWTGSLSNRGGRVRLRKPSDAIVLEVNYDDKVPWPAAADGTGHSLILARPSFGEGDVRAWEASHSVGGSPGEADPIPGEDLDHVFVSLVLSNSELPEEDFVELRNASPFTVDLSGCFLSDARDQLDRFQIPEGTTVAGNGVIRLTESDLGFGFGADGDAVYLTNSTGQRVLDAVILPPAATGIPFRKLRSDGPLERVSIPSVVINEIMFHPPTRDEEDEWIEIFNRSEEARDLSGWMFTDGIEFQFPTGTVIPAGGYLVVAKNRARVLAHHPDLDDSLVLGNYRGALSDGGERVALSRPEGAFLVVEDEFTYRDQDQWHRFADGRGASLERREAGAATSAPSNWGDSDESAKAEWSTIEFTGTLAHGNPSASPGQVQMFLLGPGECLVDEVEVVREGGTDVLSNGGFEGGTNGWFFQGNHRRSILETGEAWEGANSLRLVASRRGDPGPNRARAPLSQTIPVGSRATLRARVRWLSGHPEFLMRLRGNWLEASGRLDVPSNLGTPGAVNSRAVDNLGPAIEQVRHWPLLPAAGEEVRVTAEVSDPDGVDAVALRYRVDPSSSQTGVLLMDDGEGADLTAGDGIYSGEIPGQSAGTLVAFEVIAQDTELTLSSYLDGLEGLIRFGDPIAEESFASYRMWITEDSLQEWDRQPFRSNDPFSVTFVYQGARAVYGAGAYYGGNKDSNSFPTSGVVSYDLTLPPGEELLGADKVTLDHPVRDATNQREQLQHWFADQLNLPTLHRRDIYLYMNGILRGSRQIYHDAEQPDGRLAESHFPGDNGELFKTSNDNETTDGGSRIRPFVRNIIDVFEADGEIRANRYRWTTAKRARGSRTRLDETSILELMRRADDTGPDYEARLLEIIDMENWMRTWAMIDLGSFWDAFGNTNFKNTYLYKPRESGWVQFVWDMDVGLGTDSRDPPNQALFPSNVDANLKRMYETPAFIRSYWRAMQEALGSFYSGAAVTPLLERKRAAYQAAGLNLTSPFVPSGAGRSITGFIDQRAAFIQPQLEAVDTSFAVTSLSNDSETAARELVVSGRAPVAMVLLEVNGVPLSLEWSTVNEWSGSISLQPGLNELVFRALDGEGDVLALETRNVTYTGPGGWPDLVINEWMASNQTALADPADGDFEDWLELANPGPTEVDLTGWFLSDDPADPFKYRIPKGFRIPAEGYLLVWADEEPFQNEPSLRPDLHVAFRLSATGESLLLSAPDGSLVDRVDFATQSPDKTMGRSEGAVVALATPTPGEMNANAARSPVANVMRQEDLLTFTLQTEPGFFYQMEVSEDLIAWQPSGLPFKAEETVVTVTDAFVEERRYYRFRRIP